MLKRTAYTQTVLNALVAGHLSPESALESIGYAIAFDWETGLWGSEVIAHIDAGRYRTAAMRFALKYNELNRMSYLELIDRYYARGRGGRRELRRDLKKAAQRREQYHAYEYILTTYSDVLNDVSSPMDRRTS